MRILPFHHYAAANDELSLVIEGFPGATLEQCGLPATGYKNSGHEAEDQRRRIVGSLPELGQRQHQPHQVRLPRDGVLLVDPLQVPVDGGFRMPRRIDHVADAHAFRQPDRHLSLRRRQFLGRGHQFGIDAMPAPRLDNQHQHGNVPRSVVRLRDTDGFDVHPLKGVELHRPGPSHVETRHHCLNSSNLIITAQCVCKAANREKSVLEFGPFWSPPATAFRPGRFNLAVTG